MRFLISRRVSSEPLSRAIDELRDFLVDHLAARPRRELPGDLQLAIDELAREREDPLALQDRGEVLEREVRRAVLLDVMLDLVGDVLGIAGVPARRPHARRRAVGALVRAAAGREDRDGAPVVDAEDQLLLVVLQDVEEVPRRPRDVVHGARAIATRIAHDLAGARILRRGQIEQPDSRIRARARLRADGRGDLATPDDARDVGVVLAAFRDRGEELHRGLLALADRAEVDRRFLHRVLGQPGEVLASADDLHVRVIASQHVDHLADDRPRERPHVRDADRLRVGLDARGDLLRAQAHAEEPPGLHDLIRRFGNGIDDADLVARSLEHGRDVREPERERRTQRRQRIEVQQDRRVDQLDLHPRCCPVGMEGAARHGRAGARIPRASAPAAIGLEATFRATKE
jgi:hypothetical protein